MKKIIISVVLLAAGFSHAQSTTENFVQSKSCLDADCVKKAETIQYMDGLARPKQIVNVKASPQEKDVVNVIQYDQYSRQTKDYLPIPQPGTQNGSIYTSPLANASSVYGGEKIYSEKILESSPLDRVMQQKQVGTAWETKPVNFSYDVNSAPDGVKKFTLNNTTENNATKSELTGFVLYTEGQLYKNSVKDEDGNETIEFKNSKGQTILVRKMLSDSEKADTYYVYNKYDQLVFVIPPLASVSSINSTILDNLCYQYKYDGRSRLVENKIPGKGWEYMVYDKQDRIVLTRDALLATTTNNFGAKGWLFTKYDEFGRVVYTGFFNNTSDRNAMQTAINNMSANSGNNEKRDRVPFNQNGVDVYYTKNAFPTGSITVLSVNYYDTYPPLPAGVTVPPYIITQQQPVLTDTEGSMINTKSLPVASYVKNIEDDNWTKTFTWYDTKGRVVGTYSINHLGGYTKAESELDFTGVPQKTSIYHLRKQDETGITIKERFVYDNQNRLLQHYHQVDSKPEELLTENSYNELSQLKNKKVGNNLQSIDYTYNIRGWMTKINDPADLNGKLFGYEMRYTNPNNTSLSTGKYNGNIAEIDWMTSKDGILKRYSYQYDQLNRLKKGVYSEPNASIPENNYYNESLSYDLNGNITSLQRNRNAEYIGAQLMDNLTYSYTGNRLNSVTDISGNYFGYPDTSGNPMAYDDNGNMTNHIDKGLLEIKYNYLNLPNYIKFNQYVMRDDPFGFGSQTIYKNTNYIYRADGIKLKKVHNYFSGRTQADASTTTEYLDGFQYSAEGTGGPFGMIALNLQFVPTTEGYYDFVKSKYIYQYKDQVGNIRLAYYKDASGNPIVDRTNDFYPFGLEFGGSGLNATNSISPNYTYSFQEQEKQQDTGWNSFKWRNYDPTMGRFFSIDPLSEKYAYQSHYNFSENAIVVHRELEGLEKVYIFGGADLDGKGLSQTTKTMQSTIANFSKANKLNFEVKAYNSAPWNSAHGDAFMDILANHKDGEKIILYGYSLGGVGATQLSKMLKSEDIDVDLLVTVDGAFGPFSSSLNVLDNVKKVDNTYQENRSLIQSRGYPTKPAEGNNKTKITNHNMTNKTSGKNSDSHGTIDEDTMAKSIYLIQQAMKSNKKNDTK